MGREIDGVATRRLRAVGAVAVVVALGGCSSGGKSTRAHTTTTGAVRATTTVATTTTTTVIAPTTVAPTTVAPTTVPSTTTLPKTTTTRRRVTTTTRRPLFTPHPVHAADYSAHLTLTLPRPVFPLPCGGFLPPCTVAPPKPLTGEVLLNGPSPEGGYCVECERRPFSVMPHSSARVVFQYAGLTLTFVVSCGATVSDCSVRRG